MCIIFVVLVVVCILFCAEEKKEEEAEMRVVITERAGQTKSVSYLCFPLISDEM